MPQWADWNIDSRLDLVHAIVDGHTVRIDRYHQNTWDKAVYKGHYYSDKAPGTAILGVPVYAGFVGARKLPVLGDGIRALERNDAWKVAIRLGKSDTQKAPAQKGRTLGGCQRSGAGNVQVIPWGNRLVPPMRTWALSKYVVTIGVDALLSALFVAFFFWFLGAVGIGRAARWIATLLYAFATVALPYSANFYSHQLAAGFLFVAFALLYLRRAGWVTFWAVPAAGFLLGFSLFTEYTVALIVAVVGIYALFALRWEIRSILALGVAGFIPIAGLMAYNALCFGNALDTGYSHDFCWSAAQAAGFAGFTYPHLGPLFDLTLGPFRGLFFQSPFLLLAVPGLYLMARRRLGPEALVCGAAGIIFILAISSYWGWNGGRVDGPRYLVPVVPFLVLPAAFAIAGMLGVALGRIVLLLAAAWSLFATGVLFIAGDTFPFSWLRNPLFDYSLPALQRNEIASNAGLFFGLSGWTTLLPLAGILLLFAAWGTLSWRVSE
jgi:hypothetical protein